MTVQWTTTSAVNTSNGVKMCVHGGSGHGKTLMCATAPKPVVISAESGLLSLNRQNIERAYGVGRPDITYDLPVIVVTSLAELKEAYQLFAQPNSQMRQYCITICVDSISEIAEKLLHSLKITNKDARAAYGDMADQCMEVFRQFRDLPYHVYMAAKQEQRADAADGVSRYTVSMPGKQLGPAVPYMFDEVFALGVGKTQQGGKFRYLRTDQDLQYDAKDRSGRLDEIEEPHLGKIIAKITGATYT